jgi:hypothetical protein
MSINTLVGRFGGFSGVGGGYGILEVVYAPLGSQYTAGQTIDLQIETDNTLVLRNEPVSPNLGYYVLKPLDNFPISVTMFGSGGNGNPSGPGGGPGGNAGAVTGTIPETYFIAGNNYKLYVGGSPTPVPAGGHGSAIVINGPGSPSTAFNPLDTTIMITGGGGGGGGGGGSGTGGVGGFPAGSGGTPGSETSPGPYASGGNGGPGGTQSSGGVTPPQPLNPQGPAGGFYKNGYITGVTNGGPSLQYGGGGGGYYSGASGNGSAFGGPIPGSGSGGGGGGGSNHANTTIVTSITEYSGPGIPGVPYFGTHGPFGIGGARGPSPAQTAGAIFVKLNLN